ncbi:MAG: aromatic ring-hydroxylating dioxygenase subunit alpha [Terrimicrobiaceae bacterium]|nr:aromatic ring-hydroxylating dioxygenase subunit alpha [Terrimicrobiaceae bacterium]
MLPRNCTFLESDWKALAPHWYPVAFSHEVADRPFGALLLDERLVLYRPAGGAVTAARDICLHRGVPLSMGSIDRGELVCAYHGFRYDCEGRCTAIPAHPGAAIPPKLRLPTYEAVERYGLVWVRLLNEGGAALPEFDAWDDPDYLRVLPNSVELNASAGRQIEGFLDVSHFAFVHVETFGERQNPEVPNYPVEATPTGFRADYVSTVSNYPTHLKHLNPPGFQWRRLFEVFLPFTAKLTVFFPNDGQLHILNATCPVSARKARVFVPIARNFDKDAPLQPTLDFNHQVFEEDKRIVEQQYPEDLPIDLHEEIHIRADRSSITYRQQLATLGLGRSFTA